MTFGYAVLSLPIALFAVSIGLALGAPIDRWFAKEGASEHLGHAILVVVIVLFAIVAVRHRWAALVAAFFALVLGEELDWGGVYAGAGHGNLHNAWGGASYVIFALPPLAYFALALVPRTRPALERALGPATAARSEAAAALAMGAISLLGTLVASSHEPAMDEASELALYVLFAFIGARAAFGVVQRRRTSPA